MSGIRINGHVAGKRRPAESRSYVDTALGTVEAFAFEYRIASIERLQFRKKLRDSCDYPHQPIRDRVKILFRLWLRQRGYCAYCLRPMTWARASDRDGRPWRGESLRRITLDHVEAHSRGGGDEASNFVAACVSCNSRKCARPIQPRWRGAAA